MKTLYRILGVDSGATAEKIEKAYQDYSLKLQENENGLSQEEINNQKVAIQEAYKTLSNPILRQRYDQQLISRQLEREQHGKAALNEDQHNSFFGLKSIALIGIILLAGIYFYTQSVKERERVRIEHEHQLRLREIQLAEERQKQTAKIQDAVLEKSSAYRDAQQLRRDQQQFERESYQAQQLELQRQRQELRQQQAQKQEEARLKREEERQQRLEDLRRKEQLQRDKRLLQQMERDRYGKVITY